MRNRDRDERLLRVGSNVKAKRKAKKISRKELARLSKLSINQIGRIEREGADMRLSTLYSLSKGLGVSVDVLLKGSVKVIRRKKLRS